MGYIPPHPSTSCSFLSHLCQSVAAGDFSSQPVYCLFLGWPSHYIKRSCFCYGNLSSSSSIRIFRIYLSPEMLLYLCTILRCLIYLFCAVLNHYYVSVNIVLLLYFKMYFVYFILLLRMNFWYYSLNTRSEYFFLHWLLSALAKNSCEYMGSYRNVQKIRSK